MKNNLYITHLVLDIIPKAGLRKLLFYTYDLHKKTFHWGISSFDHDESFMKKIELNINIIKLKTPLEVKYGDGVWIDNKGDIYIGDLVNPFVNKIKIDLNLDE